ncbi:hypothetical protein CANMA_001142 [Candida margitis]|uniref:uncharacterized protein n=1 Tax=Candida margitis TaxID=1775924 RepID=UPI002226B97D|nr:uncharacterized protein CANMA_001142 [Candida margitis]KAI5969852.1 hypothetical protein CANMA_001142 [Candida margitis]
MKSEDTRDQRSVTPQQPSTSSDFLEEGSIDEESGDRWLGSDIAKALRFYQKAYEAYTKSIELDPSAENRDAYYNASRILLQVYILNKSSDGLVLENLTNIDEIFGANSIVQDSSSILSKHLKALEINNGNTDLLYNTATVYVEILESDISKEENVPLDQLVAIYDSGSKLLTQLIPQQVNTLETFVRDLTESNTTESKAAAPTSVSLSNTEQEQEEFDYDEVTQPVDVFESIQLSYRLVQALYENIPSNNDIATINQLVTPFVALSDKVSNELVAKYCENSVSKNEMLQNISPLQIINAWDTFFTNDVTDEIPEKYLSCVDVIQTVLERSDITLNSVNNSANVQDKESYWRILTQQNSILKRAQGLTQDGLNAKKKLPSGIEQGIGSTIIQLCNIMIARADLNLQLTMIKDFAPSVKNQAALLQNSRTLLKSCMNIANTSGGLRERAIEKLDREKKLSEAVFRLCLIEGKTSLQELDQIMTRPRWLREYKEIKKLELYNGYLNQIPL